MVANIDMGLILVVGALTGVVLHIQNRRDSFRWLMSYGLFLVYCLALLFNIMVVWTLQDSWGAWTLIGLIVMGLLGYKMRVIVI